MGWEMGNMRARIPSSSRAQRVLTCLKFLPIKQASAKFSLPVQQQSHQNSWMYKTSVSCQQKVDDLIFSGHALVIWTSGLVP